LRGTADVNRALDESADALDGVAREGDRAADELQRSFRDMVRNSRTAGDDIGDNMRDGYRTAERAARDFERTADDATDEAGEATGEFKDEARSNFSEVASSFSGDMTSAADLVQGTLGGLAGSLVGPAGLAAGALAIIGGTLFASVNENAEKAEARVSAMYEDFLESGADFLSKDYIAEQISLIYQGAEDAAISIQRLRDLATTADIPEPLLARALVGDKAAQEEVQRQITSKRLAINEALDEATAKGQNMAPTFAPTIQALQDIVDELDGVAGSAQEAQTNAERAAAAIQGIDASHAARSADEARAAFDGLGRRIDSLPRNVDITAKVDVDDSAWRDWLLTQRRAGVSVPVRGVPQPV
jgi:ABC-type transporter Mla subunit MlaD